MTILRRVLLLLLAVLAVAVAAGWLWLRASVPPTSGDHVIPGLAAPVTISFDSLGIPTLSAGSELDLYAAQGFIHARDRFWQMDLLRRAAEGRLSELFGTRAAAADRDARDWELGRLAHRAWLRTAPAERALLAAYTRGVNAYLASGASSLEHRLLRLHPEPWREEDTYAVVLLEARQLHNTGDERIRREAIARFGQGADTLLAPGYPDSATTVLAPPDRAVSASGAAATMRQAAAFLPPSERTEGHAGSNSWAVAAGRSRSGFPLLANDPHLPLTAPSIWHLAVLHAPGFDAEGASIPGVPGIVIGRNRQIAWGITASYVDDVDEVPEELSGDSSRVRRPAGWVPVTLLPETVTVRGAAPKIWTRRRTVNGPLVPGSVGEGSRVVARRWTGQDVEPAGLLASVSLPHARNWAEFRRALAPVRAPGLGITYADRDGHIGYQLAGAVPRRAHRLPGWSAPGWTVDSAWTGYLPFDSVPARLDPGPFVVTSNNRIAGNWYPYFLSSAWASPYRAARISERLRGDAPLDAAAMRSIQMDVTSSFARAALPIALRAAREVGDTGAERLLSGWDGRMVADSRAATLFWTWIRAVDRGFRQVPGASPATWTARHGWLFGDVIVTPGARRVAADSILAAAMRAAIAAPGSRDRWAAAHQLVERHPLGDVPVLGRLLRFNVGPAGVPGGDYTVNLCTSSGSAPPFTCTEGPSLRFVADLGDQDGGAGFILPTGESGNPLTTHYRDQFPLWREGRMTRLTLAGSADSSGGVLRLHPAP